MIALDPHDGELLARRARLLRRRGALAEALTDLETPAAAGRPDRSHELGIVLARLGELARADANLAGPSALRGVVRLLQGRRADGLDDLERAGASALLAAFDADPRRRWHQVLEAQRRDETLDGDVVRFVLGRSSAATLEAQADAAPAAWSAARIRAFAHLGIAAERRGDAAEARRCYARCDDAGRADDAEDPDGPERVWAEARLRRPLAPEATR